MLQGAAEAHRQGDLEGAERIYRQVLQAEPGNFDALHLLGVLWHQRGRREEALLLLDRALAILPAAVDARFNRANLRRELGQQALAIEDYDAALAARPAFPAAWNNRGISLALLGRTAEALESYQSAIGMAPGYAEAWNNRAVLLRELGRVDEALDSFARALEINPAYAEAHSNLGQALESSGRHDEALTAYRRAIDLRPDYAEAHCNRGLALLRMGRYAEGWEEYDWRWRHPGLSLAAIDRAHAQPLWQGQPLEGKSILIYSEQGLGDALQVLRYIPLLAARGARVVLEVLSPLKPLITGMPGNPEVRATGEPLPPTDYRCPLLGLPRAFGTTLETIPATVPYLPVDAQRAAAARARLARPGMRLVGLCWRGNPAFLSDRERSCALETLRPLFSVPGVRFVSLQKELLPAEQALAATLDNFVHPGADFFSTAQLVGALDLVISVDTAWVHWAGALGKPFWLLLSFTPHWVWLTGREDSPWYPSARLFRQQRQGDWAPVIERVREALSS